MKKPKETNKPDVMKYFNPFYQLELKKHYKNRDTKLVFSAEQKKKFVIMNNNLKKNEN